MNVFLSAAVANFSRINQCSHLCSQSLCCYKCDAPSLYMICMFSLSSEIYDLTAFECWHPTISRDLAICRNCKWQIFCSPELRSILEHPFITQDFRFLWNLCQCTRAETWVFFSGWVGVRELGGWGGGGRGRRGVGVSFEIMMSRLSSGPVSRSQTWVSYILQRAVMISQQLCGRRHLSKFDSVWLFLSRQMSF